MPVRSITNAVGAPFLRVFFCEMGMVHAKIVKGRPPAYLSGCWIGRREHPFPDKGPVDLGKRLRNLCFLEGYVSQPLDIRELLCTFLLQDDRPRKSKPSLKETDFMYYILSGFALSTSFPIFGRHNENGKAGALKHLGETFDGGDTGAWRLIELIYVESVRIGQMVSDFLPILVSAVSDKDGGWNTAWFANGEVTNVGE